MPRVATVLTDNCISLLLTRDALFLDPDGIPSPGIGLSPEQAWRLGERLLALASQADGKLSAADASSILIVHDGTARGDRAFDLAMTMAKDSGAALSLHVIGEALDPEMSDVLNQCTDRLATLQNVAARCQAEAERHNVRLKSCVMSADQSGRKVIAPRHEVEFLVLPHSETAEAPLIPSGVGRYVVLVR